MVAGSPISFAPILVSAHVLVMSFDPYHEWLGISPSEQPPNHYRLLGIAPFESDRNVISQAAEQRTGQIRGVQSGQLADLAQKILNEIAGANARISHVLK